LLSVGYPDGLMALTERDVNGTEGVPQLTGWEFDFGAAERCWAKGICVSIWLHICVPLVRTCMFMEGDVGRLILSLLVGGLNL